MSERTRYEPYSGGVFTSKNKQIAGSEYAVDNTTQTVLYGAGENTRIYDKIKGHYPNVEPGTFNKASKRITAKRTKIFVVKNIKTFTKCFYEIYLIIFLVLFF